MRRCRLDVSDGPPFACPDGCLFFEGRVLSTAGWTAESTEPMSNTALGLAGLPPASRPKTPRPTKSKKKGRRGR